MDDLSGLNWSTPTSGTANGRQAQPAPSASSTTATSFSSFQPLRPTPSPFASGRNTPLSTQGSGNIGAKPAVAKPAQDSFSNLVNFSSAKSNANLSLKERQDRLEAEKRKQEEERRKQAQSQFGDGQFFDSLGQGRSSSRVASPAAFPGISISAPPSKKPVESDDDLFAAFNANTKVDNSSHYPPPPSHTPSPAVPQGLNLSEPNAWGKQKVEDNSGGFVDDDDDPFGLNTLKPAAKAPSPATLDDDDDLLGDLGKPVDQARKQTKPEFSRQPEPGKAIEDSSSDSELEPTPAPTSDDPFDKAVAQLVDYGFTPENARRGLTESGAGLNVQAAVNWLLDDAHRQAKEQARSKAGGRREHGRDESSRSSSQPQNGGTARRHLSRDGNNRSPASSDGDFTKTAAAMGTTFLKTANSLWKTGQKKVQKAVSEFQQDGDPNQPKWMRSAQQQDMSGSGSGRRQVEVTDEAMMLESGGRPEPKPSRLRSEAGPPSNGPSRDRSPAAPSPGFGQPQKAQVPKWQQELRLDQRARLNKQLAEEKEQVYISPARRRKATPQPAVEVKRPSQQEAEPDILFNSQAPPKPETSLPDRTLQPTSSTSRQTPRQSPSPRPVPVATPRPARQIPSISAIALQSSTNHRLEGTTHFKRGDYAAAHASYTNSLTGVPPTHPLTILLRCNRALTALKTGEPRQAVEDADAALQLIGPGKGEGEHVDLHGSDNNEKRDMKELYGKALTRKAEALEQMEKWGDAEKVWQLCVESGVGGSTAIAGRQRCQKALAPKPAARPTPVARPAPARPRPSPAVSQKSSEAVERLRAANEAIEREGAEKFALTDKVDARIAAWRDGKRDNLRALLSSLDNVLWEGSGWKKVGLHELVMANKVKIVYMKAIAKTHPDKIATDASTEVRMVAGTVFSTLNEAWDKFKADNNL